MVAFGMHTFLVALVRYILIVFNEHVSGFGKNRIGKFVCKVGLGTSFVLAAISTFVTLHRRSAPWIWINQCYGNTLEDNSGYNYFNIDVIAINARYGDWSNGTKNLLLGGCTFTFVMWIMFTSNIPEAVMYCHIYWHLKRLVEKCTYSNNI